MVDYFAQELNELMGINRNAPVNARLIEENYNDPGVCKYYLVSVCPYELFPNTKYDLGQCPKRHDEFFKKQFLSIADQEKGKHERRYIDDAISKCFFEFSISKNFEKLLPQNFLSLGISYKKMGKVYKNSSIFEAYSCNRRQD